VISDIKEDVLEKLKGVRSVTYKKNLPRPEGKKDNRVRIGFLAQNLQEKFPEAVYYDGKQDTYAVEYTRMIPVLVAALNAQQKRIEQLEARIGQAARNPGNN